MNIEDVHDIVNRIDCETRMYLLHGVSGVLHSIQRLLVDVRGFDGVDLALEGHDLRARLLKRVLELLLPP